MVPAQPPLPTAWNFPFQFSAGSQTSISICESADGVRTAATRQCAGSRIAGAAGAPPPPPRPPPRPPWPAPGAGATGPPGGPPGAGCVNGPAGTSAAVVIVVFGRLSVRRLSQGAACWSIAMNDRATRLDMGGNVITARRSRQRGVPPAQHPRRVHLRRNPPHTKFAARQPGGWAGFRGADRARCLWAGFREADPAPAQTCAGRRLASIHCSTSRAMGPTTKRA